VRGTFYKKIRILKVRDIKKNATTAYLIETDPIRNAIVAFVLFTPKMMIFSAIIDA
jgi:hypothetical protein